MSEDVISGAPRVQPTPSQGPVRTVLMGDPSHFSVKGGANPHTRTRWGTKRHVNRELAIAQWRNLKATLEELGVRVVVVPANPALPGLVYPANAGSMSNLDDPLALEDKTFTLSNLLPTRAGEKAHYRRALEDLGVSLTEISDKLRFEGEADFFPFRDIYLLTCGALKQQRFVPTLGLPPWKRVYGFRTDKRVEPILAAAVAPARVLTIELRLETHYHGDTALCAFGPNREHLLLYREALDPHSYEVLATDYRASLIHLSIEDAQRYAANSFSVTSNGEPKLVMPKGVSGRLLDQVRERGTTPVVVDVSEFLKKGGGSVKCMIGDLGLVAGE
jgi:ornithine--oxo-acid transaminase